MTEASGPSSDALRLLRELLSEPSPEDQLQARESASRPVPPEATGAMKDVSNKVGRYWLVSLLGKGGMGMVFKAWDEELGRWVALKFLKVFGDELAEAHFRREAQLAAGLDHPNIAKVFEVGDREGTPYIAMQFVDGESLASAKKAMTLERMLATVEKIAGALRFAHEHKIIHRDVKPANVMLDKEGQVYVTDFGLAKEAALEGESLGGSSLVVGTPNYMAPEQAKGKADRQSDIYGIGAILYDLATGRPPFTGQNATEVILQVVEQDLVWPRRLNPTLPPDVEAIIIKALEKEKGRRYADAGQLLEDLAAYREKEPLKYARRPNWHYVLGKKIRKQPLLWASAMALVIALVSGAAFGTTQLLRARAEARRAQMEAEEKARVEKEGRERTEEERRKAVESEKQARTSEWSARLEAAHALCERASILAGQGRTQAAAALLLRAVELAPPNLVPSGFKTDPEDPGWAEEAWIFYRYLEPAKPRRIGRLQGHIRSVTGLAFNSDGKRAASASEDETVRVWDVERGAEVRKLEAPPGGAARIALSPDGKILLIASGSFVHVCDAEEGEVRRRFEGHVKSGDRPASPVRGLAFLPDGRTVVSGSADSTVILWDAKTLEERRRWNAGAHPLNSLSLSKNGKVLLTVLERASPGFWDPDSGGQIKSPAVDTSQGIIDLSCATLSSDGRTAAGVGLALTNIMVLGVSSSAFRSFGEHGSEVSSIHFALDDRTIVTAAEDGIVRIWDAESGRALSRIEFQEGAAAQVAVSPDGEKLLVGSSDGSLHLWELCRERRIRTSGPPPGLSCVALSPNGRLLAAGYGDHVVLLDAATGKELGSLAGPGNGALVFDASGSRICSASLDTAVRVWDLATREPSGSLPASGFFLPTAPAFSPDGRRVLRWHPDRWGRVQEIPSGKETCRLEYPEEERFILCAAFSPDGTRIAGGVWDNSVRLWDSETGRELRRLKGHSARVGLVAFSPDGARLLTGSADFSLRLWDAGSGRELRRFDGHTGAIQVALFVSDGRVVVSGSVDGTVRLWDARTGREVRRLFEPEFCACLTTPDGRTCVTGNRDGTLRFRALLDSRTPEAAPGVHGENRDDPYGEFEPFYDAVGLRVVRDGPRRGTIEPIR